MLKFEIGELVVRTRWYTEGNYVPNPIGIIIDRVGLKYKIFFPQTGTTVLLREGCFKVAR